MIIVAGIVIVAVGSATTRIMEAGVLAIGISLTISLAFLEVGYSEDRARARERRDVPRRHGGRRRGP